MHRNNEFDVEISLPIEFRALVVASEFFFCIILYHCCRVFVFTTQQQHFRWMQESVCSVVGYPCVVAKFSVGWSVGAAGNGGKSLIIPTQTETRELFQFLMVECCFFCEKNP